MIDGESSLGDCAILLTTEKQHMVEGGGGKKSMQISVKAQNSRAYLLANSPTHAASKWNT